MCAYNAVDGAPACANPALLQMRLRDAWHFDGFVTSDCGAVTDVAEGHKFSPDVEHASVVSLRAGTDTSCGEEYATLTRAVHDGLVKESELDLALHRLFLARYRLGMIDPPANMPYAAVPFSEVDSAAHRALALETARKSIVLLKNDGTLPLKKVKTVAVIGPNAASLAAIEGNYNAIPSQPVFPIDGLRHALAGKAEVIYAQGSPYVEGLTLPAPETLFHPAPGVKEHGLHAEYFSGTGFTGSPVTVRTDPSIQFDWNGGSPLPDVDSGTFSGKSFSIRWSGTISAPAPGDIPFNIVLGDCYPCNSADGYTVYLDGKRVAGIATTDAKSLGRDSTTPPFTLHFDDTQPHAFRVEYSHASPRFGGGLVLNWQPPVAALRAEAVQAAARSDVVVAFVGLSPLLEGEEMPVHVEGFAGGDRTDIEVPKAQQQLLEALAQTGKPVVVVLLNGSALAVNWAQQHAAAILEAWYPGEQGGTAIADTLLGGNNPAGRLPVTFYKSVAQLPAFDDYAMKGRTYRYLREQPLYEFGYGLSYTSFAYTGTALAAKTVDAASLSDSAPLTLKTTVRNTGKIEGDEVAEVYLTPPASDLAPRHALIAFERVHLRPGESRTLSFALSPRQLSQVDSTGTRAVVPGTYTLHVDGSQPTAADSGVSFTITGTQALPK
jgi:beta-glucosidase